MFRPVTAVLALALISGPAVASPLSPAATGPHAAAGALTLAQGMPLPPGSIGGDEGYGNSNGGYDNGGSYNQGGYDDAPPPYPGRQAPAGQQGGNVYLTQGGGTVADLLARLQRLEGSNRQLTGQVEELQDQLRRSQDDFRKYREDTEMRLQALEGGSGGGAPAPARKPQKRSDAGDTAPAPRQTAAAPNVPALQPPAEPEAPMLDNEGGNADDTAGTDAPPAYPATRPAQGPRPLSPTAPPGLAGVAVDTTQPMPGGAGEQVASLPPQQPAAPAAPATSEQQYSADYRLIESGQYEAAELAFRKFVTSYPKDRRVSDATHWIGESLYQRKQYRDAAEQFLKVTTSYGKSRRAPSSMLRLGMSLAAMGEKDAACATLQEVSRKYPSATASVKSSVEREAKKNACAG